MNKVSDFDKPIEQIIDDLVKKERLHANLYRTLEITLIFIQAVSPIVGGLYLKDNAYIGYSLLAAFPIAWFAYFAVKPVDRQIACYSRATRYLEIFREFVKSRPTMSRKKLNSLLIEAQAQ